MNKNYFFKMLAYVLVSPRYSLLDKIIYFVLVIFSICSICYIFFSSLTLMVFKSSNLLFYVSPIGVLILFLIVSKFTSSFVKERYTRFFYLDTLGKDLTPDVNGEINYLTNGPVKEFIETSRGYNIAGLKSAFTGLVCIVLFLSILIFFKISPIIAISVGAFLFVGWVTLSLRSYQSWYDKKMKPFLSTINNPPVKYAREVADFKNGIYIFAIGGIVYVVVLTLIKIYIF